MTTLLLQPTTCETTQQTQDAAAWPSQYYGRTRRIDLQQMYTDLIKELQQQERPQRRVSFSVGPPQVHVYEPVEYEDDNEESKPFVATRFVRMDEAEHFTEIYCKKKKANKFDSLGRRYDLRPVRNVNYTKKMDSASAPTSPVSEKPVNLLGGAMSEEPSMTEGVTPSLSTPSPGNAKRVRLPWLNKAPSFASLRRKMTV